MKIEPGSKVFITGAASGIGRSTAVAMARRGCVLFLTDRNQVGLAETAALVSPAGGKVGLHRAFDISSYTDVKSFADEIHRTFGPMDIVMNVAGIALFALLEDMDHAHWEKIIRVNLWGPIHVIECFVPEMIKVKRGHLLNVSSVAGLTGAPWHAAYATTKWGLVGLSEVLRYDLRQHGIGVTVVCPGAVDTPLKNTVEILGMPPGGAAEKEMKRRFSNHAVSPERAAELMIRAIQRDRFLVFTSRDIQFIYFCKRHLFPVYHGVMIYISKLLNAGRYPGR